MASKKTKPTPTARKRRCPSAGDETARVRLLAEISQTAVAKAARLRQNRVSDIEHSKDLKHSTFFKIGEGCKTPAYPEGFARDWVPNHVVRQLADLGESVVEALTARLLTLQADAKRKADAPLKATA
jgi:transcriptional regulator with XRE-family HTH domain